jgi:hypothetical protein
MKGFSSLFLSLKDCCALPDQMPFVLTLSWRAFVFAMRDRNRADKDEIATSVFGVTAKDFPHEALLYGLKAYM